MTPSPAATVTLVRDTPGGVEVLMLQRNFTLGFMPGVHVFPGGALDAADSSPEVHALCAGLEDETASRALGMERGGHEQRQQSEQGPEQAERAEAGAETGDHGALIEPVPRAGKSPPL